MSANTVNAATQEIPTISAWKHTRFAAQPVSPSRRDNLETNTVATALFDSPWIALAEALREGVMVISRNTKPIYLNQKAKEICQKLSDRNPKFVGLPLPVSEICHQLIRTAKSENAEQILEYQTAEEETIRLRANWFSLPGSEASNSQQYILVFLENRNQILQAELQFEQQKYQFTDREMEIWSLLRQDYSYQEIAEKLHISLNTVKTHVKNIYAKKRWSQVKEVREVC